MRDFVKISALRLLTGVAQFLVIVVLAKELPLSDLGAYSIFVIFLGYCTQIAGLSLYTFTLREMAAAPKEDWPAIQYRQTVFLLSSIATVSVFAYACTRFGVLPDQNLLSFILLLILTVMNTQNENFLVGAGRPVSAAIVLFVRTSWIYALLALGAFADVEITLSLIYRIWAVTETAGFLLIAVMLYRSGLFPTRRYKIALSWLKQGAVIGARFSVMSMLLLVTLSAPRIVLGEFGNQDWVGILHFYFVISVFGPNLVEASLYSIILPRIMSEYQSGIKSVLTFPAASRFAIAIGAAISSVLVVYLSLSKGLSILGKPEFVEYKNLFLYTGVFAIVYTSARVLHYELYAAGFDYWLFVAYGVSCLVSCLASVFFVVMNGLYGAAWAQLASGAALCAIMLLPFAFLSNQRLPQARAPD